MFIEALLPYQVIQSQFISLPKATPAQFLCCSFEYIKSMGVVFSVATVMNLPGVGSAVVDIAVKVDIKFEEASSAVVIRPVTKQDP